MSTETFLKLKGMNENVCHKVLSKLIPIGKRTYIGNRPTPENTNFGTFSISAFSLHSLYSNQ